MTRWAYPLLLLLLVPLQTTGLNTISLGPIKPDLGLLLVYFVGFYAGESEGLVIGLLAGALLDLFSGGPLGLHLATKAIVGVSSGMLGRFFLNITGAMTMSLLFLISILSGILIYFIHELSFGGVHFGEAFGWIILPEALYNAVVGGLLFWIGVGRLRLKNGNRLSKT